MKGEKCLSSEYEEVDYMYSVMKKVGSTNKVVCEFNSISEARDYLSQENIKNYVPASKMGRVYGSVGIWDVTKTSVRILNRKDDSFQKTLYHPDNESKLFIQYSQEAINKLNRVSAEIIPFPINTNVVSEDELPEAA